MCAGPPAQAAHSGVRRAVDAAPPIYVGGREIRASAFMQRRRLYVPVRGVFEAIGAIVEYSPPHFIVVRKDGAVIAAFILDRTRAIVGHSAIDLDVAPMRHAGRVYVPLRVVAEAAGATVTYRDRPSAVYIRPHDAAVAVVSATGAPAGGDRDMPPAALARWRFGVAVFTGLCCLGCLVLTARRFAPGLFRQRARTVAPLSAPVVPEPEPPSDRVELTSVEATGEARFHTEVVTETRTIEVPVTREELVIEYSGEGGNVIIEGRQLIAGETVRIPLWEERVQVDVTKHVLVTADIVVEKRRGVVAGPMPAATAPPDFSVAEGSPS